MGIGLSSSLPIRTSSRVFFLTCSMLGYIFISSYTSILSATMIVRKFQYPFQSLEEVANNDALTYLIRNGSAAMTYYQSAMPGTQG